MSPLPPPGRFALRFDVPALERDPSSIVLVDPEGIILWANPAWYAFFDANGGSARAKVEVGAGYFEGVRGRLRDFYLHVFGTCLETGLPYEQDYECSSIAEVRSYRLRILPVDGDLLVTHTLRSSRPRLTVGGVPPGTLDLRRFEGSGGIVLQCSNCRRLCSVDDASWEWVAEVIEHPPDNLSHGLCHVCEGFYYGALGDEP